jgi:acetaldehyde dehydrogenase
MSQTEPLQVAVIGAGLIGIDLLTRIQLSQRMACRLLVGRDDQARGLRLAERLGCPTGSDGISSVVTHPQGFDLVFDASNATAHAEHWAQLKPLGAKVIDLTPSMVGHMVVPTVNGRDALTHGNVNLVSCGGQASIPILHALATRYTPTYIEVVTTAASQGVGRATRLNLDEYIDTTQRAIQGFTGVSDIKVMVNLSPAQPPTVFRVAMTVLAAGLEPESVRDLVKSAVDEVRAFVPGIEIAACTMQADRAFIAVHVQSTGDHIPRYAGNLDIINSAAVLLAEQYAANRDPGHSEEPS